jgi:hypothetical protein
LGTGVIPDDNSNFSIDFDFVDHHLKFQSSNGRQRFLPLKNESVASFYERVMSVLDEWGINPKFSPRPNELPEDTPCPLDTRHRT